MVVQEYQNTKTLTWIQWECLKLILPWTPFLLFYSMIPLLFWRFTFPMVAGLVVPCRCGLPSPLKTPPVTYIVNMNCRLCMCHSYCNTQWSFAHSAIVSSWRGQRGGEKVGYTFFSKWTGYGSIWLWPRDHVALFCMYSNMAMHDQASIGWFGNRSSCSVSFF